MKTTYRIKQPYADIFLECAKNQPCISPARPERFIRTMKENRGSIGLISGFGQDEEGLERKNPVIVALGDSVTAGHFESLLPTDRAALERLAEDMQKLAIVRTEVPPIEITDARECYLEKFRHKLIDRFEYTSVSTINAGIAGDNLIQMSARAKRDVIRYQPDLVLINGALNWDETMGTTSEYKSLLIKLIKRIKNETTADIILLTPNGDLPNTLFGGKDASQPTTPERVQAIREAAFEESVSLADVYAVWESAKRAGCPWKELLANGINHPSAEGHEVYAITLMKLIE